MTEAVLAGPAALSVAASPLRQDLRLIADMVAPGSRVLDIGCDDGTLLAHLAAEKGIDGRGIELSQAGVNRCVARGLSVIQGDADNDLEAYPAGAFDYVILSRTLQATHRPRQVLDSLCRIGRRAIVSLPNFAYWRVRLRLLLSGRMPQSALLDYEWYDTPNIHLCTIRDFAVLVEDLGLEIEQARMLGPDGTPLERPWGANWRAEQAVFLLRRADQ